MSCTFHPGYIVPNFRVSHFQPPYTFGSEVLKLQAYIHVSLRHSVRVTENILIILPPDALPCTVLDTLIVIFQYHNRFHGLARTPLGTNLGFYYLYASTHNAQSVTKI